MRTLLSHLILPLPILWILIVWALILYKRKKKASQIVASFSLLWFLVISTPFVPNLLVKSLESRYSVISEETIKNINDPVNILVLGGGHTDDENLPPNSQLSTNTLARLVEGIRIHQQLKGSILITSGHGGPNETSNAKVVANTALSLGIDSNAIKMQENPENTYQEAINYKQVFGDSGTLILVSSAAHMPRVMYLFRKAGLHPIAAPADFLVKNKKKKDFFFWFPSSMHIEKTESAIHEYVGLFWYKLGGK